MAKEEFISTGIEKLDTLLEGGTPKGFSIIILGGPGSSIEILAKQLATTGNVLYFTTEETEEEVLDTMTRFGWKSENIKIVEQKEVKEAKPYIDSLSMKKYFWNKKLRANANRVLEMWDAE